ncbi:MAG: DUF4159 domain-containing protein [Calditrichaeota bacterium]|nr:MAG: DUF4159 domain-containing protein [Calditrichota bacterium]
MKRISLTAFLIFFASLESFAQSQPYDDLTFVRLRYSMGDFAIGFYARYGGIESWQVDFPEAEEHFMRAVKHQTNISTSRNATSFSITDKELFNFAFAYVVEVGFMKLTAKEASTLREWLLRGGFLLIDDFHGPREWQNFYDEFSRVFPDHQIVDVKPTHPIFHCYYDFDEYPIVPGLASIYQGRMFEKGGREAHCKGIFDGNGRLMVLINHNMDLGDSWEHANDYRYESKYSILGYKLGINYLIYALTH